MRLCCKVIRHVSGLFLVMATMSSSSVLAEMEKNTKDQNCGTYNLNQNTFPEQNSLANQFAHLTSNTCTDLSCVLGEALKSSLRGRSVEEKRHELRKKLDSLSAIFNRYRYPPSLNFVGRLLVSKEDYFVQDAFISSVEKCAFNKNTYGAFKRIAEEDYLAKTHYNFINDPNLKNKINLRLEEVNSQQADIPKVTIQQKDGGSITTQAFHFSNSTADEIFMRSYIRKLEKCASPLFDWLVQQPVSSVSNVGLYLKSVDLYEDPWMALGVMSWLLGYDAQFVFRKTASVASSRMQPILENVDDHAGTLYHMWGYVVRTVFDPRSQYKNNLLSLGYEKLLQNDSEDRIADKLGLKLGAEINAILQR